jgi:hypothetical protein
MQEMKENEQKFQKSDRFFRVFYGFLQIFSKKFRTKKTSQERQFKTGKILLDCSTALTAGMAFIFVETTNGQVAESRAGMKFF